MEELSALWSVENFSMMGLIGLLMQFFKKTLEKLKVDKDGSVLHILMPYLPVLLGAACAFVPDLIQPVAMPIGAKIFMGGLMGGMSGQGFKIIKSKFEVVQGKVK